MNRARAEWMIANKQFTLNERHTCIYILTSTLRLRNGSCGNVFTRCSCPLIGLFRATPPCGLFRVTPPCGLFRVPPRCVQLYAVNTSCLVPCSYRFALGCVYRGAAGRQLGRTDNVRYTSRRVLAVGIDGNDMAWNACAIVKWGDAACNSRI